MEQFPGPEQLGLDGPDRQFKLFRDLLVGVFLEIPQLHQCAVPGFQFADNFPEKFDFLIIDQVGLRVRRVGLYGDRSGVGVVGGLVQRYRGSTLFTDEVNTVIRCNLEKPGAMFLNAFPKASMVRSSASLGLFTIFSSMK